ncbi:hypothetical protein [Parahaliea aestuarii]|uniref:UDP-glucuronosyltransferase n=1 Tax=Parahaliea aestuarii TaxID=1852021 RepID=A0A5C9A2I6_9GAMM|nr:hypothetical protein [Parahaliea aestuarii]TXS93551.1 hypothetical protein FVW59_06930 [Parahaliea aestuarii]
MANILLIWELGGASGHLANLSPWLREGARRGHRITLAAPARERARQWFADLDIDIVDAPRSAPPGRPPDGRQMSFTQIMLHSLGDAARVTPLVERWQSLFETVQPDTVIYEFAPTALIASLGGQWQKWIVGNGYTLPRADLPYFGLFPRIRNTPDNAAILAAAEARLAALVNAAQPLAIAHPAELFTQADQQLLMTLPEIDPFGTRPHPPYLGISAAAGSGAAPQWPDGAGFRVFAYLQPFPGLQLLLQRLGSEGARVLVYSPELPPALRPAVPGVVFSDTPVDLDQAFSEAELAITMGNHTTTAQAWLAGVPLLVIPRGLEQFYTVRRMVDAGRAVGARADALDAAAVDAALALARRGRFDNPPLQRRRMGGEVLGETVARLFDQME